MTKYTLYIQQMEISGLYTSIQLQNMPSIELCAAYAFYRQSILLDTQKHTSWGFSLLNFLVTYKVNIAISDFFTAGLSGVVSGASKIKEETNVCKKELPRTYLVLMIRPISVLRVMLSRNQTIKRYYKTLLHVQLLQKLDASMLNDRTIGASCCQSWDMAFVSMWKSHTLHLRIITCRQKR